MACSEWLRFQPQLLAADERFPQRGMDRPGKATISSNWWIRAPLNSACVCTTSTSGWMRRRGCSTPLGGRNDSNWSAETTIASTETTTGSSSSSAPGERRTCYWTLTTATVPSSWIRLADRSGVACVVASFSLGPSFRLLSPRWQRREPERPGRPEHYLRSKNLLSVGSLRSKEGKSRTNVFKWANRIPRNPNRSISSSACLPLQLSWLMR